MQPEDDAVGGTHGESDDVFLVALGGGRDPQRARWLHGQGRHDTLPVANLVTQPGTYFAIVTAFNNAVPQGESGASNEVSFQITAPAPTLMAPNAPTGFGVR